jgi:hypothetical protein
MPSITLSGPIIRDPPSLHVGDLDVEGHVAGVPLRPRADATADPDAVSVGVPVALNCPVVHRVVGVDFPAEQLRVVALELVRVLAKDLEVHDRLSHDRSLSRRGCGEPKISEPSPLGGSDSPPAWRVGEHGDLVAPTVEISEFDVRPPGTWFYTKAMRRRQNSASVVTVGAFVAIKDGA